MKNKTGRIAVLMTPATSFEKYFSRWLVSVVVFLVVFLIAFRLADYTRVLFYTIAYPDIKAIMPVDLGHLIGDDADHFTIARTTIEFICLFLCYLFVQSCFILGSTIWPKNSFVKTFAAYSLIIVIYVLISWILTRCLFVNEKDFVFLDYGWGCRNFYIVISILLSMGSLFSWILGYYRFKESEVIHRM